MPVEIIYRYGISSEMKTADRPSRPYSPGTYEVQTADGSWEEVDVYVHAETGCLCVWDDDLWNMNYYDNWQSYDYAGHVRVEWIDGDWRPQGSSDAR